MSVRFCTTCGRTYADPDIEMCPHDGTPLFGMAGESDEQQETGLGASPAFDADEANPLAEMSVFQNDDEGGFGALGSDDEQLASDDASDEPFGFDDDLPSPVERDVEDDAFDVGRSFEDEDDLPAPIAVAMDSYDDLPAPTSHDSEGEEIDLFAGQEQQVELDEPSDDLSDLPAPVSSTEDLFGDSESEEEEEDSASSLLLDEPSSDPFELGGESSADDSDDALPMADDAASVQIAADIESTLGELGAEDSNDSGEYAVPSASASLVDTMAVEDELSVDAPETELPPIAEPEKRSAFRTIMLLGVLAFAIIFTVVFLWYIPKQEEEALEKQRQEQLQKDAKSKVVEPVAAPVVKTPAAAEPVAPATPVVEPAADPEAAAAAEPGATTEPATKVPAPEAKPATKPAPKPATKRPPKRVVKPAAVVEPVKPDPKKKLDGELDKMMN